MRGENRPFPDYSFYSVDALLAAFAAGPARLRAALSGLSEEELRARPRGPASWSAHEIVLHTADSELQGAFRIRKVWSEPGALLPGYDQDAWAGALDYASAAPSAREGALELLALLREQTLRLLSRAGDREWRRQGVHPEYGSITLRNLLELYADHVERHIEQILRIRALTGRGVPMEILLPRRLY